MTQEEFEKTCNYRMYNEQAYIEGVPVETYARRKAAARSVKRFEFSTLEKLDGAGIIERIFSYRYTKKNGIAVMECAVIPENEQLKPICRNILVNGFTGGLQTYGHYNEAHVSYYGDGLQYDAFLGEASRDINTLGRYETFDAKTLSRLDEGLRYSSYKAGAVSVIPYIRLYRRYPVAEMCMKTDCTHLCTERFLKKLSDKKMQKWLYKNASDIARNRIGGAWCIAAYNRNESALSYYNRRILLQRAGESMRALDSENRAELLAHWSPVKVYEYIYHTTSDRTYNDYITACRYLHLDLSDTKNAFPHDFQAMHEERTKAYKTATEKDTDEKMLETAVRFSFLSGYESKDFCIFAAISSSELINEGESLHHCVGRMGYNKKQAKGESIIFFVRKMDDIKTPFATIELEPKSLNVRQCYGDHNRQVPEITDFLRAWRVWGAKRQKAQAKSI